MRSTDGARGPLPDIGGATAPRRAARIGIVALMLCISVGCASSKHNLAARLDPKPLITEAISKAVCLTGDQIRCDAVRSAGKKSSMVPLDEHVPVVKQFIREYAYGRRDTMKRYLAQADKLLPMVKSMAKENGLPEDIAYLFLLESGANPEARSPANALGMWQFMPATARSYGLRVDSWVDERLDPKKSTQAALTYLKDLYGMFGCWRLALSAYNSGENKLNKVLCQEDADEYDEICSSSRLKRETREFVPRFQAIAHIAKNPDKYGFAPVSSKVDPEKYEYVVVEGSYSFDALARAMRVTSDELGELNPSFIRGMTPPSPHHPVRVPLGKKETLLAGLKSAPQERGESHIVHVVNKGESVARIAGRYGVPRSKLAHLNPDVNLRKKLKPGAKLVIPVGRTHSKERAVQKRPDRLSQL